MKNLKHCVPLLNKYVRTDKILDNVQWEMIKKKYEKNNQTSDMFLCKKKSIYSQNGEDGVLSAIINKIPVIHKYYVEFGAWNGEHLSNTRYLREYYDWKGLLLEGDKEKILSVEEKKRMEINLNSEIITGKNINHVFKKYNVPYDFDLLSIDIDGDDYWVWKGLTKYRPAIVIIETNPGLPNEIPLCCMEGSHDYRNKGYFGANLSAMLQLADLKNYTFVTCVRWNPIFIRNELFHCLGIEKLSNAQIINKYFIPNDYWYNNRDKMNKRWIVLK